MSKTNSYYKPPTSETELAKLPLVNFIKYVQSEFGITFASYFELHQWSCECYDKFWEAVLRFTKIQLKKGYSQIIENVSFDQIPKWFIGAELNYAENLLYTHGVDGEKTAVIEAVSNTDFTAYSYKQLRKDVIRTAITLRRLGITTEDRVVACVTNSYETTVCVLAAAAVGAAWSSASLDFGAFGIIERFSQLNPKVLFATACACYKKRFFNHLEKIDMIVKGLPSLRHVILLNPLKKDISAHLKNNAGYITLTDLLKNEEDSDNFEFVSVPFYHPLYIMFSSGTTGPPKGMVHTTGGTLLKHVEEHILQTGFTSNDTIFFYTTCGWMMWNWLMSCFYVGMTVILYDESSLEPDRHVLLKIAAYHKCTVLGMGAKIYDEYQKYGGCPATEYDLSSIRMFLSTASPLCSTSFRFLNDNVRKKALIGSISGGTDIMGCFMGGCEILPVVEGECQCAYLGMDIAAYVEEDKNSKRGRSVYGKHGELVCRRPFPSMPSYFINDPDGSKYHRAYFERFDSVWAHGDFCCINPATGGIIMLGRSDATLNRGGVRIGTAEIYAVVQTFTTIADTLAVSQKTKGSDERIILFVKMMPGEVLTESLVEQINKKIRNDMSPRHVPNEIRAVPDIPYTRSGKKVEMAIKQLLDGKKIAMVNSLRNPESLKYFSRFASGAFEA